MPILIRCACGRSFRTADANAGKRGRCPGCGAMLTVPSPEQEYGDVSGYDLVDQSHPAAAPQAARPVAAVASMPAGAPSPSSVRKLAGFAHFVLLLALIPLTISTLHRGESDIKDRLTRTIVANPEVLQKVEQDPQATLDGVLQMLPGHRIQGALLARDTWSHWGLGGLAAGAFFSLLMVMSLGAARAKDLLVTGVFTGTLGILFLLAVQYIAEWTQGFWIRGGNIVVVIFYIVKFIGFSYRAALGDTGFVLSFLGFTCGVGLCEEVCKAIPLLWHYQHKATLTWRGAMMWGLASGFGFGISEGITYASDFYNGLHTYQIYVVRFVSCVALHAIWAASVALSIHKRQNLLQSADSGGLYCLFVIKVAIVPIVLHGLYDTLLKKDMSGLALLSAVASFALLAWQAESHRRSEGEVEAETAEPAIA